MVDTERQSGDAGTAENKSKDKEMEKKKRSRVKQLMGDVKKQVEFWFGDVNLHKDRFLRKLIDESDDGYVDISVLADFNRMKKLTTDAKLIARALNKSAVVEVDLEGNKVRRQLPIGDVPKNVDSRTVYVELLPKDVTHSWVERAFTKCGNVVYVSIPRYKSSGDPKGFAFVEFEKEEEAHKAIQMLNNPPEDAPRKPGMFPKMKRGKPISAVQSGAAGEEEERKKKKKKKKKEKEGARARPPAEEAAKAEAKPSAPKRKRSSASDARRADAAARKTPGKLSEKKRRRSQTTESESQIPSKIRRTSESEGGGGGGKKGAAKTSSLVHGDTEGGVEEGKENRDDAAGKAKRKRKKKHKEKLKNGEEAVPLRVLSKKDWLMLKGEYLTLQKRSMSALKKCVHKIEHQDDEDGTAAPVGHPADEKSHGSEKPVSHGPAFTGGVIVKITGSKPLPGRKVIKEALSTFSPVAYVDSLDGDSEGHVRFHSPEDAAAVSDARERLQRQHGWKVEILSGDHEQRYWQKILVDRQVKLNRPREKKRGTEKLISKAEKIILARAKEAHKHIRFHDD
ncbi:la-related protein 7 [Brachionichthys hirsutus]|uniref:la-related protein 7 n=1 Tax=Brachionichthys hirsutus TaxID=412623 RepID=UPI0036050300